DSFLILDFGGNIDRHGMYHTQRDWKEIFFNPPEKGINPAPMKECPECGALNFGDAGQCEICGHEFQHKIETKEQQTVSGYLKAVWHTDIIGKRIDDLGVDQLLALEKSGKFKPSFIWRVLRTRSIEELKIYCEKKGYSNGFLYYQKKQPKGYKNYRVKLN